MVWGAREVGDALFIQPVREGEFLKGTSEIPLFCAIVAF